MLDDDAELAEFVRALAREELSLARKVEREGDSHGRSPSVAPDELRRRAYEKAALVHQFYQETINRQFIDDPVQVDRRERFIDGLRFALEAIAAPHADRPGYQEKWAQRPRRILRRAREANWNI